MAAVKRDLYADFTNGRLVVSSKDKTAYTFPAHFHQDLIRLAVHPLEIDPTRNITSGPYAEIPVTGLALTLKVFTSDGATVLASLSSWTVDPASNTTLIGQLNLNTAPMVTAFASGSTTSINSLWEFEFSDADGKITIQIPSVTIKREYIVAGTPEAIATETYYTKSEMDALFVRYSGNPAGASITLKSANGLYEKIDYCKDDGSNASDAGS